MRVVRSISIVVALMAGRMAAGVALPYDEQIRAELNGVLSMTRLSVSFDGVTAREAFRSLSVAINTPIIGRFSDDAVGYGINPDFPVTLHLDDVPARYVLELILDQVALDEPCTWQMRRGSIEVGTKERLSAPAAVETRTYIVGDLLLQAPYFANPFVGGGMTNVVPVRTFYEHPYSTAALTRPVDDGRKAPDELIEEIAEGIVEMIEPGNWDYGQYEDEPAFDDDIPGSLAAPRDPGRKPVTGKVARLRIWRDRIVIAAPDFIHRQIMGYPGPIAPKALTEAERQERSARASSERAQVTVLPPRAGRAGR